MTSPAPESTNNKADKDNWSGNIVIPEKRKRSKYTRRACTECQRRKVKCDGAQPCQRCGRQRLECVYGMDSGGSGSRNGTRETETIDRLIGQIQSLQAQVDSLSGTRDSVASSQQTRSVRKSSQSDGSGRDQCLSFHGPTTSYFSFGIARESLQTRGITDVAAIISDHDIVAQEPSPMSSPSLPISESQPSIDPLWIIGKEEAIRLCHVYEEEMGIMYPVLDLAHTTGLVTTLYTHTGTSHKSRTSPSEKPSDVPTLEADDINILKLVFACALTAEESGHSELGLRIFNGVKTIVNDYMWKPPDLKRVTLLMLVSVFLFQIDEESLAWRVIGTVERMCLEMGLHRKETFTRPEIIAFGPERVLRLFWSVYTLDMRWSIGTGMPYHLDSSEIDPSLPRPSDVPYLSCMIDYSAITERAWKFIRDSTNSHGLKKDEMIFLDWQVQKWTESLPASLKLPPSDSDSDLNPQTAYPYPNRGNRRLQCLLHLRGNLMRMLIYRPVLTTQSLMTQHPIESETVVEIAKETIRFITHLDEVSNIYRLQQVTFNWFLISALATLFIAVAHLPTKFSVKCKDEFYMAIDLIEGFSTKSYISQRLWKSIKSLRRLAPQLGLRHQRKRQIHIATAGHGEDGASALPSAARRLSNPNIPPDVGNGNPPDVTTSATTTALSPDELLTSGTQMSRELMDWFEAMGNLAYSNDRAVLFGGSNGDQMLATDNGMAGDGGELESIFRDWF